MTRLYLDASAAAKLLVEEVESAALADFLDAGRPELVASILLETELRRLGTREGLSQASISEVLDTVALFELPRSAFHEAGLLPGPTLRSLDALHLASALRLNVDAVVAYDARLVRAASDLGIAVESPG